MTIWYLMDFIISKRLFTMEKLADGVFLLKEQRTKKGRKKKLKTNFKTKEETVFSNYTTLYNQVIVCWLEIVFFQKKKKTFSTFVFLTWHTVPTYNIRKMVLFQGFPCFRFFLLDFLLWLIIVETKIISLQKNLDMEMYYTVDIYT